MTWKEILKLPTTNKRVIIIRHLVWLGVVLGASIGCLITVSDRIQYLISDPLSTTISFMKKPALTFPAVTVCNVNKWRAEVFDERITRLIREQVFKNNTDYELNCEVLERLESDIPTFEELTVQTKHRVEDFIFGCEFAGKECGNITEVFEPVFTNLGICYTFNSGKVRPPLQSTGAGERHGLQLKIDVELQQYLTSADAGVKVAVHAQSEPPLPDDYGFGVPTGKKAFIGIKQQDIQDKTQSRKHCRFNNDLSNLNFLHIEFPTYSESACLVDCQHTSIANDCKCISARSFYSPDTDHYSQLPNCTLKEMCCIDNEFISPKNCNCPAACSSITYEMSISYTTYPVDYVFENIPLNYTSTNFLQVSVYFETLRVEMQTTYHAYSFIALLSDIGGQVGLFLGLSVISVLEFGDWIVKKTRGRDLNADVKKVKNKCSLCYQTHSSTLNENLYEFVESEASS